MRTLTEITTAIRRNQPASYPEMRYALVAYDVLISKLAIEQDEQQVAEFFKAAESCPKEYAGPENDPENPEFVKWHTEHINNRPEVFERAMELLDDETTYYNYVTKIAANINQLNGEVLRKVGMAPEMTAPYGVKAYEDNDDEAPWSPPATAPSPAVTELIKAAEDLDSAWVSAAEDGSTTAADLEEWAVRSAAAWVAVAMYGDEPTPGQPPVTICTTCTRLHTSDECPWCVDVSF